jgi:ABC-type lipoprotein export system ATPase subunit
MRATSVPGSTCSRLFHSPAVPPPDIGSTILWRCAALRWQNGTDTTSGGRRLASAVRVTDLRKEYVIGAQTLTVLRDVSLDIEAGEIVAVMGPSGSGKSTLLNLVGGLDTPTSGSIVAGEADLATMDDEALARYRRDSVGFIFQSFNLVPSLTARQNVQLPLMFAGIAPAERERRALEALTQVGLAERVAHLPTEMSGGEQQRVATARAIINDPAIILGDEPTGNLDSKTGEEILALIRTMNAAGRTFLITTHDPYVASIAHRIVHLADGAVVDIVTGGGA